MGVLGGILTVVLTTVAVLAVTGFVIYQKVNRKIREVMPGVSNLSELADFQRTEMEDRPKSIQGMESLAAPQILEDFPGMSIEDLRSRNQDEIFSYFKALESGDASHFATMERINDQIEAEAQESVARQTSYQSLVVHKHAISRYGRMGGVATISFQMALEFFKKDIDQPQGRKTQTRVETQWIYLPDEANFGQGLGAAANCPNCGAPISSLALGNCEHCGSAIAVDFTRTWGLSAIGEK